MTWLVWRQHRNQALFGVGALAAFGVLLLITGLQLASKYHSALASCTVTRSCGNLASTLSLGDAPVFFLVTLTMAVPVLLGLFWGAPLVARELETGTSQFAWMQSVTRRHWLTVKTGWILLAAAAWGGALSALVTWWSSPENALSPQSFDLGHFDIQGIVPAAYALFAVALGIAVGTLVRRVLPALAVTLGVFAALRIAIADFVRPHYMTAITMTFGPSGGSGFAPAGSMGLGQGTLGPNGQALPNSWSAPALPIDGKSVSLADLPSACRALYGQGPGKVISCLSTRGYRGYVTYQPGSRYWTFQGIETGIFVALSVALVALTLIVLTRRDA